MKRRQTFGGIRGAFLFVSIFALCLFPVIMAGAVGYGDNPANTSSGSEKIIVGVPTDRTPILYIDENTGEITGIGADMMKVAAENAGFEVEFRQIKESNLMEALDNRDYDLVMPFSGATPSASGETTVISQPLFRTPFTLLTKEGTDLPGMEDIRIGMLTSQKGVVDTIRQLYPRIDITMFGGVEEGVKALRKGEVDALLNNGYVWSYVLKKPSYEDLAVQSSALIYLGFYASALNDPKKVDLVERLNRGIILMTDAQRQGIILDYTTRKLYKKDFSDYLYMYGPFMVLGLITFVAVVFAITMMLRTDYLAREKELREMSDRDSLTGVLNYNGFKKRAEEIIREHPDTPYLIAYNNVKNFKYINERMGRASGDELLRFWVDKSLKAMDDEELMSRYQSDRFLVLRKIGGLEQIKRDEEEVIIPVRNFYIDKGEELLVRVCTGLYVLMPEDYANINIDRMVDHAMAAEKKCYDDSNDTLAFFNPRQWEQELKDAEIVSHLPTAIRTGELRVWYQPQIDYNTKEISGAEALCRWYHKEMGWISPGTFVPALEKEGKITDLDRFVWEQVCRDLQRWNKEGRHRSVSVNLSRCDIQNDPEIAEHFFDLINKYGLTTDQLHVEITETAYVEDSELLIRTTTKLREYGFRVEMDDFGSGYSSLNMLKEVPVERIKLDLRFLAEFGNLKKGRIILDHIIHMLLDLDMSIIAEGVETIDQAEYLLDLGCTQMQGYFFFKPMPVKEFEEIADRQVEVEGVKDI